ncbi:DUF397 domain-containing protein [Streptomyces caniscabiei]|uniref:DUF397 domain-containing protein n=1 Tax=Streptomyces caniscabiei TaxID=2746961 RepID=UPI0018724390|nr:DUF397 domain-containing protein [Streptomyces caniscabiei]MBE4773783.1 DUF397 domain-containing protein [Streptomyces caniscabiei]MDX2950827.1 DUF397 domain-containing protein [Streptomyces caniscabiei]
MNRTLDLSAAVWRKSSYSDGGGTNCLEVTDDLPGIVPVRDSKVPDSRPLLFTAGAWSAFVKVVAAD